MQAHLEQLATDVLVETHGKTSPKTFDPASILLVISIINGIYTMLKDCGYLSVHQIQERARKPRWGDRARIQWKVLRKVGWRKYRELGGNRFVDSVFVVAAKAEHEARMSICLNDTFSD